MVRVSDAEYQRRLDWEKVLVRTIEGLRRDLADALERAENAESESVSAGNRALIAEKQAERARHIVFLYKEARASANKAIAAFEAERDQLQARVGELEEIWKVFESIIPAGESRPTLQNMAAWITDRDARMKREGALEELEGCKFYTMLVEQLLSNKPSRIQIVTERVFAERAKEIRNENA